MKGEIIAPKLEFSEFESLDLNRWMERIKADLKGKNWQEYLWEIEPGLVMDPAQFNTAKTYQPIFAQSNKTWLGHTLLIGKDTEKTNKELLDLLMLGISAPKLKIEKVIEKEGWEELFQNVSLQYLQVHFNFSNSSIAEMSLNGLNKAKLNIDQKQLVGSVSIDEGKSGSSPKPDFYTEFPKLKFVPISSSSESVVDQLSELLLSAKSSIELGSNNGDTACQIFDNLLIGIRIGNSFLVEIAKLRAARLLFNLLAESYELPSNNSCIQVSASNDAFCGEAELDVIRMTSMALAANLAGADIILLPNLDNDRRTFLQRITANIQHILNLESHLGKVGDPLAGSHYLEALTDKIAQKAWSKFQAKV